jgi:hypothetical protein
MYLNLKRLLVHHFSNDISSNTLEKNFSSKKITNQNNENSENNKNEENKED